MAPAPAPTTLPTTPPASAPGTAPRPAVGTRRPNSPPMAPPSAPFIAQPHNPSKTAPETELPQTKPAPHVQMRFPFIANFLLDIREIEGCSVLPSRSREVVIASSNPTFRNSSTALRVGATATISRPDTRRVLGKPRAHTRPSLERAAFSFYRLSLAR
jgi:hypothetical protein